MRAACRVHSNDGRRFEVGVRPGLVSRRVRCATQARSPNGATGELHLGYIPAGPRRKRPGPHGFLRAIPASLLAGCTGLEPVASGVTVSPAPLGGGSQVLQLPVNTRIDGLQTRSTSRTLGEFRSPLGTPVVRAPEAYEVGRIRFLTVREVAEALRICRATVYKAIASGSIAHVRVSNAIRIPILDH